MGAGFLRQAAACLTEPSADHHLLMDGKNFPPVTVRIGEPEFILPGEATGDVLFDSFKYFFMLQVSLPLGDLLNRVNLDPQMIHDAHVLC